MSDQVIASSIAGLSLESPVAVSEDVPTKAISNEMRAVIKRLWGRGPAFVRVLFANDDTIVVLLTGILTEAEKSLLAVDRDSAVISQRAALNEALEPQIRVILETNLGRDTGAFMSGIDLDRDMASVVVTLGQSGSALTCDGARHTA